MSGRPFRDRTDAGWVLAAGLSSYAGRGDVVVLGLPRGGVPVAAQVASALDAPLDVFVVRKLGVPGHPELAMGAIAAGGIRVLNPSVVESLHISQESIDEVAAAEEVELARRMQAYRGDRPPLSLAGRVVIVVDDGLATGATMRAAVAAIRASRPGRIVVAVPVGARQTCEELQRQAEEVVCARVPLLFQAVGQWYQDFSPTSDEEIRSLLGGSGADPVSPA
ncbi:MAG: phosphoribosyltransferase [Actinomycetota bacterium]|nr:phosphoribosyltransferase [Actinomycetota bacterium]